MDYLKIYIITFNCGRKQIEPEVFANYLFDGWEDPSSSDSLPDLIVFKLQEIAPLGYAFLGNNFVKPYFHCFRQALKTAVKKHTDKHQVEHVDYFNVIARNSGLTGMMVFTKDDLSNRIQTLNIAEVGVGVSEMGNKGAIGMRIGWQLPNSRELVHLTFVSAHLAPFEAEMERRDQDYRDIVKGLVFTNEDAREWREVNHRDENVPLLQDDSTELDMSTDPMRGMYTDNSYLFFGGDLNYRTALTGPARDDSNHYPQPRKDTKDALHYAHLLEKDQLTQQLQQSKTLHGLTEQKIDFPPTYKYKTIDEKPVICDDETSEWQWSEHRWPSWCDRILFSSTSSLKVKAGKYAALPIFRTSDHRPVALSAAVPLQKVSASDFASLAPVHIDRQFKPRRDAARRKELAVGLVAYLGWTWEGNALVLGTIVALLGAVWVSQSVS
ncbi:hypothetical protein H2198_000341 [Neophaeococcomyces mojaviensis]|uniref:Uncharacterized protein n=1 Tax=Neophaeococcomyces mojaviensis TaxID=3383035 RepID=A0ACC3AKF8_9EURO|nr:hypothetical protein H2198_000341 [Knufia sp. JES_112]